MSRAVAASGNDIYGSAGGLAEAFDLRLEPGMRGELVADVVERSEIPLRWIGGELGFGCLELPVQRDAFPVQRDHLLKAHPGVRGRRTGREIPFVQMKSLAFEAGHERPKSPFIQVVLERRPVKAFAQGGHIYEFTPQRVKLARPNLDIGKIGQEGMH